MSHILVVDGVALGFQLFDHCRQIDRVPSHDRIGHQIQAVRLIDLLFTLSLSDLSFVGKEEEATQGM